MRSRWYHQERRNRQNILQASQILSAATIATALLLTWLKLFLFVLMSPPGNLLAVINDTMTSNKAQEKDAASNNTVDVMKKHAFSANIRTAAHNNNSTAAAVALARHGIKPRTFEPWSHEKPLPCFPPEHEGNVITSHPTSTGFFFMKLMKTGGSTAAGIHIRISRNVARRQQQQQLTQESRSQLQRMIPYCRGQWDHAWAYNMLKDRQRDKSFTWTLLRDPTRRVASQFFHFEVTREGTPATDESFQKYLWEEYQTRDALYQYYVRLLSIERRKRRLFDEQVPELIQQILSDYDFIGITERMEESAVALMMLLGLQIADVLYLDAKSSGGYDDGSHDRKCYLIQPSFVSPGMKQYFESSKWKRIIYWDQILYEAANASLDLTIEQLGRGAFNKNLALFRKAQAIAREKCLPREVFPCTFKGERNPHKSCLWKDSGCGSDCLDEVATELSLW